MQDDCGSSTPKAPRELRQRLKNGEITEEEFERQRLAIKTSAAKARLSVDTDTQGEAPDAPPTPGALARQFSEMMDPEVGIFALDACILPAAASAAGSLSDRMCRALWTRVFTQVKNLLAKVKLGKEKEVKEIIGCNPAILKEAYDMQGNTILHLAALNGCLSPTPPTGCIVSHTLHGMHLETPVRIL
jgi:hypothetical protein